MNFSSCPQFDREFKAFSKKWRTLKDDLERAKRVIAMLYASPVQDRDTIQKSFFDGKKATKLAQTEHYEVVKMRLDCSSGGAQGKLRLVFVFLKAKDLTVFIELYAKNDKDREDSPRIARYVASTEDRIS
ncbi:MAG: hypothetical protein LBE83_02280 [Propionibacteriaceae bacterium]|jgi:hypothetical protein|nr:hypothetical protein [Propionibacteriaceae bacterium]